MLKKTVIAAAVAAATLLSACQAPAGESTASGSGSAGDGGVTIGVSLTNTDVWLGFLADAIEEEAAALGVDVQIISAEADSVTQLGQVENFVAQEVDAIIVNPVDTEAIEPVTNAVVEAGIPLVYVNRCPAGLPETIPCVGSDSVEAGTLLMEAVAELNDFQGTVGILEGDPNNNGQAVRERTAGCQAVIDENDGMELTMSGNGEWSRDAALAITENWIQSGKLPDMICANNDEMALGAILALKAAGLLDQVTVGGIDATADALAAVEAGELEVTVFQDPAGQGAGALQTAMKLINGETTDGYVNVPFQLVTEENLAEFK
ncbi:substrate-binding domain-containing protein [Tessaracoccus sp. G1721]